MVNYLKVKEVDGAKTLVFAHKRLLESLLCEGIEEGRPVGSGFINSI